MKSSKNTTLNRKQIIEDTKKVFLKKIEKLEQGEQNELLKLYMEVLKELKIWKYWTLDTKMLAP